MKHLHVIKQVKVIILSWFVCLCILTYVSYSMCHGVSQRLWSSRVSKSFTWQHSAQLQTQENIRKIEIFYVAGKTELIITITNVCCLHLWVYVFISVLVYLCFCPMKIEFQTFGERTALQSENILDHPQVFVSPKCITFSFAPIFKVGYTETTKRCVFNVAADALWEMLIRFVRLHLSCWHCQCSLNSFCH